MITSFSLNIIIKIGIIIYIYIFCNLMTNKEKFCSIFPLSSILTISLFNNNWNIILQDELDLK